MANSHERLIQNLNQDNLPLKQLVEQNEESRAGPLIKGKEKAWAILTDEEDYNLDSEEVYELDSDEE